MLEKIKHILRNPFIFPSLLICKMRSRYYSNFIDEGNGKILVTDPFIRIMLKKDKTATLAITNTLTIKPQLGGRSAVAMILGKNSRLEIGGDFLIGNGVRLSVGDEAVLHFGGRDKESGSGITSDTLIMANKRIIIGKDFLCAWGIFISDSDWHTIENQSHQADVVIGDHVWIANNVTVLKGSIIGDNSIIAGQSKVINKAFPANCLLAGIPAKIVKSDINWSRDI